jgi:predicted permease
VAVVWTISGLVAGVFALILLISCANVANLQFVRLAARRREIAVRVSLGASRPRVIQQLLVESSVIACAGGVLGVGLALWSFRYLVVAVSSALPSDFTPISVDPSLDLRVVLFSVAIIGVSTLLSGWLPAVRAAGADPAEAMKSGSAGGGSGWNGRTIQALVALQVTFSVALVIGTALLARGMYTAETIAPGFAFDGVNVASFNLSRVSGGDPRVRVQWNQLVDRIKSIPGVNQISVVGTPPLGPRMQTGFTLPGSDQWNEVNYNQVSPSFFALVDIPIVRGRLFRDYELESTPRVVIVTESLARRLWSGKDPLKQHLLLPSQDGNSSLEVIGVARDAQLTRLGQVDTTFIYLPVPSTPESQMTLLIKSSIDSSALMNSVKQAAREVDPTISVNVRWLEENLRQYRTVSRLVTSMAAGLGLLALLVSTLGVYSAVAYSVTRQTRDVGIRLALGAQRGNLLATMLFNAIKPTAGGALTGIAVASASSRVLGSLLFGISPGDSIAFAGALIVVVAVALVAALVPVRRALSLSLSQVLRLE